MKLLPKVTQRYVVSKIATFETLSAMSHSQNSIFHLDLQLDKIFSKYYNFCERLPGRYIGWII